MVAVGDVWWLPARYVRYPGGKDRFCLVVALEHPSGGQSDAVVHFVAGSRKPTTAITIKVEAGDCGLNWDTYFRFWWSGSVPATTLAMEGTLRGRVHAARLPEIERVIRASNRAVLKGLLP